MKKIILFLIIIFAAAGIKAQFTERLSFAAGIGTGIALSTPECTPFSGQITGYYNFSKRLSASIGTGISVYEKLLIPVFAGVKFNITRPHRFTPFIECSAGYSFATAGNANGGLYLNPSIGVQYAIGGKKKLLLAAGYEIQKLERLKEYGNELFTAGFHEHLNHNSISIRTGFIF